MRIPGGVVTAPLLVALPPQWVYLLKLVPRLHDDAAAARAIMESDPCVTGGVMTATLHPYAVALLRERVPAG